MKFALGKKINMTQVFGEDGTVTPVTVLGMMPLTAIQVKTIEKDGYAATQFGAGIRKEKNISKAVKGHVKGLGNFEILKEYKGEGELESFAVGDRVIVSGISKGKGFQGVVKRHGFHGGPRTHGQKHSEREAGSIGGSGGRAGGRVAKGMRMAGRMGSNRVTVKNLKVIGIDAEGKQMLVSGAIPGRRGSIVEVRGK
jgi:large subunit ribosomal protein L3